MSKKQVRGITDMSKQTMSKKQVMEKQVIFLDGAIAGTKIEDNDMFSVEAALSENEYSIVERAMESAGSELDKGELVLDVPGVSSILKLSLRKKGGSRFLNLSGNPLTFFRKHNLVGYANSSNLVLRAYLACVEYLQKESKQKLPRKLMRSIGQGDINVHSLEFAAYTKEIDKVRYLTDLQHVFGQGYMKDGKRVSLESALGVRITQNYDNESLGIAFPYKKMGIEKMLLIYDKEAESGISVGFLQHRLRYDMQLTNLWFSRRRIKTLRDLQNHFNMNGGEVEVLSAELEDCVKRACLEYMYKIKTEDFEYYKENGEWPEDMDPNISYDTHLLLWTALRTKMDIEVCEAVMNGNFAALADAVAKWDSWLPNLQVEKDVRKLC